MIVLYYSCFKSTMSRLLLGFTVCQLFLACSLSLECYNVNTNTHRQVDQYGRERYFHGVNVVVKGPPWIPEIDTFDPRWSFSEKDMQMLNDLGLNTIRYTSTHRIYHCCSRHDQAGGRIVQALSCNHFES